MPCRQRFPQISDQKCLRVHPAVHRPTARRDENDGQPLATKNGLADIERDVQKTVEAGARILNLSLALTQSSSKGERALGEALDHAAVVAK